MRDPLGAWALVKGVVSAASPLVSRQARRRSSAGSRMQLAVEVCVFIEENNSSPFSFLT